MISGAGDCCLSELCGLYLSSGIAHSDVMLSASFAGSASGFGIGEFSFLGLLGG
jgi:hypothetical protein